MTPPLSYIRAEAFVDHYVSTIEQKRKTVPVVVPLGTGVDTALKADYAEGFVLEGTPVPMGITDHGAVYSVTLTRSTESAALMRGLASLMSLSEDLPESQERMAEIAALRDAGGDLGRAVYAKMRNATLAAADDLDAMADVFSRARARSAVLFATQLRSVADVVRTRWPAPTA